MQSGIFASLQPATMADDDNTRSGCARFKSPRRRRRCRRNRRTNRTN